MTPFVLRQLLVLICLIILAYIFFRKEQNVRLNWALFFAALWGAVFLLLINALCVHWGLWSFPQETAQSSNIPPDLYFIWLVLWFIVIPLLSKGKHLLFSTLLLFYLDYLLMPLLVSYNLLVLEENWLIGELLILGFAYLPAQLWFRFYLENKRVEWRCFFQFIIVFMLSTIGIPYSIQQSFPQLLSFSTMPSAYLVQIIFILCLPAIIAIIDMAKKAAGTPFPFDPTQRLIRSGAYAFIQNPIQWSLTFIFIPLAIIHQSYLLLLGSLISIIYAISIARLHEKEDMAARFGQPYLAYRKQLPSWYFLWRPIHRPQAHIYIKKHCKSCSQLRLWLEKRKPSQLIIKTAESHQTHTLYQLTYVDEFGHYYSSVKALAHALEHINLAWASLGWFMRLPLISHLLQLIVDSVEVKHKESCDF